MTTLREAAQMALDALEQITGKAEAMSYYCSFAVEIESLRAALAQPEQESAYGYALRLATAIWEKHYKDESPHWEVNDSLLGVLTQIDNMTTGLAKAQPEREWQGLTDEEIDLIAGRDRSIRDQRIIRGAEAKLREKNQ